jgi:prophage antirepressor-like protein
MSNQQTFDHMEILGMSITAFGTQRRPLFLVEEVAKWLDYEDVSAMLQNVDEDEIVKMTLPPEQCLAGLQPNTEYLFLSEAGFYETLMLSKSPIAKGFKKGVKQVLHDVRTGTGMMQMDSSLCDFNFAVTRMLYRYFTAGQRGSG